MARNSAKKMIFCLPSSLWYKNKRVSQGKIEEVARDEFRFSKVEVRKYNFNFERIILQVIYDILIFTSSREDFDFFFNL